ncbi:MAG: hypothetical protein J3Q66DRAFT_416040 [Benniella sp.]|nr:MAG: hypothetical protein J3Q66DRAFT_416040 [Benniella sp.]
MDNTHVASAALSVLFPAPHCDNLRSQRTVSCMTGPQYPECLPAPAVVYANGLHATTLSIQTPTQDHLQPPRSSFQQYYTLLPSPYFLPDVISIIVTLQRQVLQQQQQLVQQQLQLAHQQLHHMQQQQQQYAQNIESLYSLLPSPSQTPPQQLGLLDDGQQSIHTWPSESLESQDVWDQAQHQEELRMTDLLFTPEHLQISPPTIDQSSEVPQQNSSSTNEVLESTACERNNEEETHSTTKAKRTRKPLRVQRRLEIIAYWEMNKSKSMTELSRRFDIPRSTAYGIINDRQALKKLVKDQSHPGSALERYRVPGLRLRNLKGP